MAEAARIAPALTRPTWVVAKRQTAGRGRQGRPWVAPEGNLYATLVYRPECSASDAARRSFMAANALFEALALHVDRTRLSKKWPNDVLLDDGKIAGILLEASGQGVRVDWLAIGIGVNIVSAPEIDAPFPPVALAGQGGGACPDPMRLLSEIASNFDTEERMLREFGFDRIRRDWLRDAARLGAPITARTARGETRGTFDSIDEDGNLVLISAVGPVVIPAGEVFF